MQGKVLVSPAQLAMLLEGEEIAAAAEAKVEKAFQQKPKAQPKRKPLPDHLPREEQVITPSEACGRCGGKLKRLGEDVTEALEFIPGRFSELMPWTYTRQSRV